MPEISVFLYPILRLSLALPLFHSSLHTTRTGNHNIDIAWDFSSYLKGVVVGASLSLQGVDTFLQMWDVDAPQEGERHERLSHPRTPKHFGDVRSGLFLLCGRNRTSGGARASWPAAAGVERQSCPILAENHEASIP